MNIISSIHNDKLNTEVYHRIKDRSNSQEFADLLSKKVEIDDDKGKDANGDKAKTESTIIVKPDGTRVLIMTISVGGMETSISIQLSKTNEWDTPKITKEIDVYNKEADNYDTDKFHNLMNVVV